MRSWKVLAAVGAVVAVVACVIVASAQTEKPSGAYPRRLPGMANFDQFEIQAPWGGTTTARRLGVTLKELAPSEATERKLPGHSGVLVETVQPKSPAEKAGIKPGDVIIKINGEIARSIVQVRRLVNETPIGLNALVTVFRGGKTMDLSVAPEPASPSLDLLPDELENRLDEFRKQLPRNQPRWFQGPYYFWREPAPGPDQRKQPNTPDLTPGAPFNRPRWPLFEWSPGAGRLGVVVQDLSPQLAEYFKVKGGVLIASVTPESAASRAGLKAGDVITAVDGKDVKTPDDLAKAIRDLPDGREVSLSIVRSGTPMTIRAKLGHASGVWHV
jgi:serine protease Do